MKLAPPVFWAMTLQEFQSAVGGHSGAFDAPPSMTTRELDALMQHFPDGVETQ